MYNLVKKMYNYEIVLAGHDSKSQTLQQNALTQHMRRSPPIF